MIAFLSQNQFVDQVFGACPFRNSGLVLRPTLLGDGVVAPAGARGFIPPIGEDQPGLFQAAECRIEGSLLEFVLVAGFFLHGFVDFISIAVLFDQLPQNDGVRMPTDHIGRDGQSCSHPF